MSKIDKNIDEQVEAGDSKQVLRVALINARDLLMMEKIIINCSFEEMALAKHVLKSGWDKETKACTSALSQVAAFASGYLNMKDEIYTWLERKYSHHSMFVAVRDAISTPAHSLFQVNQDEFKSLIFEDLQAREETPMEEDRNAVWEYSEMKSEGRVSSIKDYASKNGMSEKSHLEMSFLAQLWGKVETAETKYLRITLRKWLSIDAVEEKIEASELITKLFFPSPMESTTRNTAVENSQATTASLVSRKSKEPFFMVRASSMREENMLRILGATYDKPSKQWLLSRHNMDIVFKAINNGAQCKASPEKHNLDVNTEDKMLLMGLLVPVWSPVVAKWQMYCGLSDKLMEFLKKHR